MAFIQGIKHQRSERKHFRFFLTLQAAMVSLSWIGSSGPLKMNSPTLPGLCAYLFLRLDNDHLTLGPGVHLNLQVEGVSVADVINRAIQLEEEKGLGEVGKVALASSGPGCDEQGKHRGRGGGYWDQVRDRGDEP